MALGLPTKSKNEDIDKFKLGTPKEGSIIHMLLKQEGRVSTLGVQGFCLKKGLKYVDVKEYVHVASF